MFNAVVQMFVNFISIYAELRAIIIVIFAADNGNRPCPRHVFCKRHARQQAQHHDKCQRQCKLFFHIIPLLFNTINIILLDYLV